MKKFGILSAVWFLAGFILLPAIGNGEHNVSKPLIADGSPLPWPPFPPGGGLADTSGNKSKLTGAREKSMC